MTEELILTEADDVPVVERIRSLALNQDAASNPQSIAQLLQLFINVEPELIPVIGALFPNNPAVQKAVSLLPTLLPFLKQLEAVLVALNL